MSKKLLLVCLALLLSISMLFSACADTTQESSVAEESKEESKPAEDSKDDAEESEETEEPREVVTLEVMGGGTVLHEGKYWTKMLEEELGIKIQGISNDKELLDTYIAAGDLPDLARIDVAETQQLAYQAGLLANFDDYADLMPNVLANTPAGALQFQRDKYDDGGLHTLPTGANTYPATYGSGEYAMRLDFPYYQEYVEANGEPELKEIEDFLPVLQWIQQQHPTNEEGQPAYGMSIFAEWDGDTMGYATWFAQQYGVVHKAFLEINQDTLETKSIFDDDSYYKRMVKLFFTANQMGILDPDSMTQTWDDYCARVAARRVYSTYCFSSNEYIKLIPYENYHTVDYTGAIQIGNANGVWGIAMSSSTEYAERCVEFLDYMMQEENHWKINYGPQGEAWDLNADGMPYLTEKGLEMSKSEDIQFEDGGTWGDSAKPTSWNWRFLNNQTWQYPMYGNQIMNNSAWPTAPTDSKSEYQTNWENWLVEKYDITLPGGSLTEIQLAGLLDFYATSRSGATGAALPDDLNEILGRIKAICAPTCWQMVYASSEAEFESLWDSLVTQATDMGVDQLNEWYEADYKAGVEGYEAYCY